MAAKKGNQNAKGNSGGQKGKSGRPSLQDEIVKAKVINLSWEILAKALESPKIKNSEKRRIAIEIAKKTIPAEIKGDLNGTFTLVWQNE